jgi:hypothetical protein
MSKYHKSVDIISIEMIFSHLVEVERTRKNLYRSARFIWCDRKTKHNQI